MYKVAGTELAASTSYDSTLDSAKNQMPPGGFQANRNPAGIPFDVNGRLKTSGAFQLGYAPDISAWCGMSTAQKRIYFYSGNSLLGIYDRGTGR
jgi:hypothetical protein